MIKILVPIDDGDACLRCIDFLIKDVDGKYPGKQDIHLINVQRPLSGEVGLFLDGDQITDYHHDEGIKALAEARRMLDAAATPYTYHIGVGDPAEVVTRYALAQAYNEILLSAHNLGTVTALLSGSVVFKIIQLSEVPLRIIK